MPLITVTDRHQAFLLRIPPKVDRRDVPVGKYGTHSRGRSSGHALFSRNAISSLSATGSASHLFLAMSKCKRNALNPNILYNSIKTSKIYPSPESSSSLSNLSNLGPGSDPALSLPFPFPFLLRRFWTPPL